MLNAPAQLKNFIVRFFTINDSPHKVAGGAALGLFMGIVPGGVLTALFLAAIFRLNKLAAGVSAVAFSFWSTLVTLPAAAVIGGFIFQIKPQKLVSDYYAMKSMSLDNFLSQKFLPLILDISLPIITGLFIVGFFLSLGFYLLLLRLLEKNKIRLK